MPRHLRILFLSSAVLGVVALLPAGLTANHSWNGYHWPIPASGTPVQLTVNDAVDADWDSYLDDAIDDWNAPIGGNQKVIQLNKVGSGANPRQCRPVK